MKDLTIRKAETADVEGMTDLLRQLFEIESDFAFDRKKASTGLAMLLQVPDSLALVAMIGDQVVGMCTTQTLVSTAEGGKVGLLEDMVVADSFRNQSIGEKLLTEMEALCRRKGLKRIQLLADKKNIGALRFYDKLDWAQTDLIALRKR